MILNNDTLWLPNSLQKDIKKPIVIYEEYVNQNYGGYYTLKTNKLTVVVRESRTSNEIAATIAHEYCHYLQYVNNGNTLESIWKIIDTYEESIKRYFSTYTHEMEALLFEYKYSKCELNDWWLNKLVIE